MTGGSFCEKDRQTPAFFFADAEKNAERTVSVQPVCCGFLCRRKTYLDIFPGMAYTVDKREPVRGGFPAEKDRRERERI